MYKLVIEDAVNGIILHYKDPDSESEVVEKEIYDLENNNVERLLELLYAIVDKLDFNKSRYAEKRIKISIVHGDKYICKKKKKCKICNKIEEKEL